MELRAQLRNLLQGRPTTPIKRPLPVKPRFEPSAGFVGLYGAASDPVEVSEVHGHLIRDENEFYPIGAGRYGIPASGAEFWFRRGAGGIVDAMVTVSGTGVETVLPRIR